MGVRLMGKIILISLLLLEAMSLSGLARSQEHDSSAGVSGAIGLNRIEGHVCYPGGSHLNRQVPVKIRGASGAEGSTLTDDTGAFNFSGLKEGRYYISVDAGRDFDPANEEIDVVNSSAGRRGGETVRVQINLRYRSKETYRAATIAASSSEIPQSALKLYIKAQKLAQDGNREKAIEQLNEAISIYPQFANAFNELGVQYLRLRQMEQAEIAFQSALEITPHAFAPRLNYGILLVQVKKYDQGASLLKEVSAEDDSSAAAHLFLGRALIGLNSYAEAEKQLSRAAALEGSDATEAHRYLGAVYIEEHKNQLAAHELETYLQLSPNVKDASSIRKIIAELRRP